MNMRHVSHPTLTPLSPAFPGSPDSPCKKMKNQVRIKDVLLWKQLFLRKGQFTYRYAFIAFFSSNSLNDKIIHQFSDFGVEVSDSRCTSGGRNSGVSLPLQWHR